MRGEHEVDQLIETYRTEITAEAELARGDLDEIEDHLRALVAELRDGGMPLAEAVETAARRLGEPREVAAEHARVRTSFGAKLSRGRAWIGAGFLIAALCVEQPDTTRGVMSVSTLFLAATLGLIAALLMRRGWARALLLGVLAPMLVVNAVCLTDWGNALTQVFVGPGFAFLVFKFGLCETHYTQIAVETALFLAGFIAIAPWRVRELSRRSIALSLLGVSLMGALGSLAFYADIPHVLAVDPIGSLAAISAIAAIVGTIRGSAWTPLAAAIAACTLGVIAGTAFATDTYRNFDNVRAAIKIGAVALPGAIAALGVIALTLRGKHAPFATTR